MGTVLAPNASFFRFCNELLAAYRDDERVMHVSGDNFVGRANSGPYGYYFSKYTHASGWATWRRAWRHFGWTMSRWPELKAAGMVEAWCADPYERRYWSAMFDRLHHGDREVWDLQWNFACWSQGGLAVLPAVNLVLNDGWGPDATHTKTPLTWPAAEELGAIEHPPYVVRNAAADAITFDRNFGGAEMRAYDSPSARFRARCAARSNSHVRDRRSLRSIAAAGRRRDGRRARAPRSRRQRRLRRRRRGLRLPPAEHHRLELVRPPADVVRRRPLLDRLQRGDLQLRGAAARARGARPSFRLA